MKKLFTVLFLATIFLVKIAEATSFSSGSSLVLIKTIQGKFNLLDEKGEDDFSETDEGNPKIEVFYKVISTGIPREKISHLVITIWNCEGREKNEFSEKDFRISPDGKIAFPIGITVNQELFRIFSGEFLIKIYQ